MPEPGPRKLLLKGILALLCLLLLLAGGAVLVVRLMPARVASAKLLLPDGTSVSVAGTTFGTNHVFGGPLARFIARTPSGMQATLARFLGPGAVARQTFSTPSPALLIWLNSPTIPPLSPPRPYLGWYEIYLADTNGFVSGEARSFNPLSGGLAALQFDAFPRRDRTLSLHFFYHDTQGKVKDCGTLTVLNPEFRAYPQWQPETLPVTKKVGDIEATLIQISTGLENNMNYSWLPGGGHVVTFSTNRDDGRNDTACRLPLRSLTDTNQVWQVDHVELSDATGNVLRSTSMSSGGGDDIFSFGPALWTNESAWKLRCEIKRTKGFAPAELFTFKNVPVPELFQTNQLGWTTNVTIVTVTLDHIIHRPPLTNFNGGWSTSQLSEAHFRMTGLSNDLHLDLIEIHTDNGTNVESPSSSTGDNTQDRYLRNIPPDAKTLDFTFAVQRGRWVEFLVKPETGSARFGTRHRPSPGRQSELRRGRWLTEFIRRHFFGWHLSSRNPTLVNRSPAKRSPPACETSLNSRRKPKLPFYGQALAAGELMLTIRDLKMSMGARILFENAALQVNYGDRVALVGPNGAGKSTLFSIILKRTEPDEGTIQRDEWTMVGYLPQEGEAVGDETVMEVATGKVAELPRLEKRLHELESAGDVASPEYLEAHAKHDALNDPQVAAKAKKMLTGLGYRETDFDRPARELSGGWIMRAHLARLLVMEPDLLLLDEPTNHLDLLALLWLQNYLKNYSGAVLMISHDRQFMDEIVTQVYDISEKKIISYAGNYSDFLVQREANYENRVAAYKNQQKEISALQEFADRFRAIPSKASQAMSKLKQIERLELIEKPTAPRKPFRFQIPPPPRGGQKAVTLEGIHMAYGSNVVYAGLDLTIERGERTVLVGPNGAGKSTLLKILAGAVEFQRGERKLGHNARIGYFSQHRADTLDANRTVLEEVLASSPALKEDEARAILGSFMFRKEEIHKPTGVLSGGEKSRLNLVKFLVDPPNLLLMDEPTTHLDITTVESLTLALERYEGSLVFISHDVHFIRHLATKVLHVNAGQVKSYPGNYDYFLEKTGAGEDARAALTSV